MSDGSMLLFFLLRIHSYVYVPAVIYLPVVELKKCRFVYPLSRDWNATTILETQSLVKGFFRLFVNKIGIFYTKFDSILFFAYTVNIFLTWQGWNICSQHVFYNYTKFLYQITLTSHIRLVLNSFPTQNIKPTKFYNHDTKPLIRK